MFLKVNIKNVLICRILEKKILFQFFKFFYKFYKVKEQIKEKKDDDFKFDFIFVVPDVRYEKFGYQAVKCNENLIEQALEATKITEEELEINLLDLSRMTRQLLDMDL